MNNNSNGKIKKSQLQPGDIILQSAKTDKNPDAKDRVIITAQKAFSDINDEIAKRTVHAMVFVGGKYQKDTENNLAEATGETKVCLSNLSTKLEKKQKSHDFTVYRYQGENADQINPVSAQIAAILAGLGLGYNTSHVALSPLRSKDYGPKAIGRVDALAAAMLDKNRKVITPAKKELLPEAARSFFCSGFAIAVMQVAIFACMNPKSATEEGECHKFIKSQIGLDFDTTAPGSLHQFLINAVKHNPKIWSQWTAIE